MCASLIVDELLFAQRRKMKNMVRAVPKPCIGDGEVGWIGDNYYRDGHEGPYTNWTVPQYPTFPGACEGIGSNYATGVKDTHRVRQENGIVVTEQTVGLVFPVRLDWSGNPLVDNDESFPNAHENGVAMPQYAAGVVGEEEEPVETEEEEEPITQEWTKRFEWTRLQQQRGDDHLPRGSADRRDDTTPAGPPLEPIPAPADDDISSDLSDEEPPIVRPPTPPPVTLPTPELPENMSGMDGGFMAEFQAMMRRQQESAQAFFNTPEGRRIHQRSEAERTGAPLEPGDRAGPPDYLGGDGWKPFYGTCHGIDSVEYAENRLRSNDTCPVKWYTGFRSGQTDIKEASWWNPATIPDWLLTGMKAAGLRRRARLGFVVAGSDDGTICVWEAESQCLIMKIKADESIVNCVRVRH